MIKVERVSTKYHLEDTDTTHHMFLEVGDNKKMTLTTGLGMPEFRFERSTPKMVRSFASMMLHAVEIAKSEEKGL